MPRATRVALLLALLLAACGGDDRPALPARQPTPLDHATTGVIRGHVRFDGAVPAMKELRFGGFAECAAQHAGPVFAGDVLVADHRVENAFVYVQDGLGERVFAVPATPVVIDQKGCLYHPRVVGAQVGQTVRYVNSDPALHNVHATPAASPGWNFALARLGLAREVRVERAEVMVSVRCDLHPWMQGWLGVVDHPYFAVTGADGAFRLPDVPPGTYTVTAWHERFGTQSRPVTLPARGDVEITFTFAAP